MIFQEGPKCHYKCPYKREAKEDQAHRTGEDHVKRQAEIRVMQPQAQEQRPATNRSWKRQRTDSPLELLEGSWPRPHLDFGLLASRTMRE